MAKTQSAPAIAMSLALQEPDPSIQLRGHVHVLVVHRQDADECRVVRCDLADVGVGAVAEGGVAVAADLGLGGGVDEEGGELLGDVEGCDGEVEAEKEGEEGVA